MIILSEVAKKLENILNGVDEEINVKQNLINPTQYHFFVEAQGFHIDHIISKDYGENLFPVFVSSMGGQFNPVKGLKQGSYVIPITFYFPVRFRDTFFKLGDYLIDAFVGQELNYGVLSGSAISNLSVPTFGEIQNFDLQEFKKWVADTYQNKINVKTEPFMSMSINLYLTDVGEGFIFGNSVKAYLKKDGDNDYTEIVFDTSSIQSNAQTNSEQEIDATTPEGESLPFGTAYGIGFTAYPRFDDLHGDWWYNLLKDWCDGKAQNITLEAKFEIKVGEQTIGSVTTDKLLTFKRTCFIQSFNVPMNPGQVISCVISLGKKIIVENEET